MKKYFSHLSFILLFTIMICLANAKNSQEVTIPETRIMKEEIDSKVALRPDINFGKIPLYFISNKGQVNQQAKFYAKTSRYTLWLTKEWVRINQKKCIDKSTKF